VVFLSNFKQKKLDASFLSSLIATTDKFPVNLPNLESF